MGGVLANNGHHELRAIGCVRPDSAARNALQAPEVSAGYLQLTVDRDCLVEAYLCHRPLAPTQEPPTWQQFLPRADEAWQQPGGLGEKDARAICALRLTADCPGWSTGKALVALLAKLARGQTANLIFRRADDGPHIVSLSGLVGLEVSARS